MPTYPSVTFGEAQDFYRRLSEASTPSEVELARVEAKSVTECDVNVEEIVLRAVSEVLHRSNAEEASVVELEAKLIPSFYWDMRKLPIAVLHDSDFWRYICCGTDFHLWVAQRDGQKGSVPKAESFGASSVQIHADTVSYRMFVRGDIAAQVSAFYASPTSGEELLLLGGSDVWKSHIVRTLNALSPMALAGMLAAETVVTDTARAFFPHVKRIRSNVVVDALSPEQALAFGDRVKRDYLDR